MTDYDWMMYLREDQTVNQKIVNLTTTAAQLLPANPLRRAIHFPASQTQAFVFFFLTSNENPWSIFNPTTSNNQVMTWEQIGDLITYPIWGSSLTAPVSNVALTEMSVCPGRWALYRRYLSAELAKLGAL